MTSSLQPSRRFLHVCWCCADLEPVVRLLVDGLDLRNTMSTPPGRSDGRLLGLPGEMESTVAFVYDARGPRTSPAVEVQQWIEPPLEGVPETDPTVVGIRALGLSVPDLDAGVARLAALGCEVVASGDAPFGGGWTTMREPAGITVDLVGDPRVPAGESRLRHLRVTCTDLDRSLAWYDGMGFELLERHELRDAAFLGAPTPVDAVAARLRLREEAFEVLLIEWRDPASHGRHYDQANHAGIYRAATRVDDTRASYEAMRAAGWTFDHPPVEVELSGTPVPDMWICFLSDPDGVPFELVQRPASIFRDG